MSLAFFCEKVFVVFLAMENNFCYCQSCMFPNTTYNNKIEFAVKPALYVAGKNLNERIKGHKTGFENPSKHGYCQTICNHFTTGVPKETNMKFK